MGRRGVPGEVRPDKEGQAYLPEIENEGKKLQRKQQSRRGRARQIRAIAAISQGKSPEGTGLLEISKKKMKRG